MANQERTPVSGQYLEYLGKPLHFGLDFMVILMFVRLENHCFRICYTVNWSFPSG